MRGPLGSETFVYLSKGGPHFEITALTETGHVLERKKKRVARVSQQGWVYVQNRHLGLLPLLNEDLFLRLLEVLTHG